MYGVATNSSQNIQVRKAAFRFTLYTLASVMEWRFPYAVTFDIEESIQRCQ